jgi:predicted aspartyl protease
MRLLHLSSMHAAAVDELRTAHSLDKYDPNIQRFWVETLPLKQRIAELEAFLASGAGIDATDRAHLQLYLDSLKKRVEAPPKACRLVSSAVNTEIPFSPIMHDATRIRAFGLDVKLNDHGVRLEIDTGASGLLISSSMAERAGLTEFSKTEMGGVGSQGNKQGYVAFVDSIKIGTLEFRDCAVTVLNGRNVVGSDGLIGMDVFSNFLVTLDYPMRKLALGPLPQRPEDVAPAKPILETEDDTAEQREPVVRGPHNRYIAPEMKDWTPVYRSGHQLMIRAMLNRSKEKLFILDTGSFLTTISSETARELGKLHVDDRMTIRGISGKVDKVYYADNVTFHFANLAQKAEEAFAYDTSNLSKNIGLEISGLIGFTTLGQLTMHIDYRDGLVKFDYNPNRGYR